jgi:mannose-6-phosphate isomerase-like protein (cupin superfamily)
MSHVSTTELAEQLGEEDESYLEVLSEESMSVELARYPNSAPKTPHKEDELYVVLSGSGKVHVGGERHAVDQGDVVYVEQGVEHEFFDIDEEITVLIVFASAEESVLGQSP